MKIYSVHFIRGYYIGEFTSLKWTDLRATVQPTVAIDILGIERNILEAYWGYLWRLGEHTFGGRYSPTDPLYGGPGMLERWAEYAFLRLWPKYGRLWSAVGATKGWFDAAEVVMSEKVVEMGLTSRVLAPYDIIMRYKEFLWWGRFHSMSAEGKMIYQQGTPIGPFLMFERRSKRKTPPFTDAWDFGMCFWEIFRVKAKLNLYLWAYGEAEYLGFGIRKSADFLTIK